VLLGDYLVARAFDLLPAEQRHNLVPEIVEVATRMCQGQVRELRTAGRWPTEEEYFAILEGKTGALFDFCGRAGARSAGGSPREVDALAEFGADFGVAYQMADDILDLVGSEGQSGKPEGVDLTQGKLTLPLILAAAEAPPELRGELDRIVSAPRLSPADIDRAREIVYSTQATDRAWSRVGERLASARAALDSLPETPARNVLLAMAGDEFPMPVMA
jgi:octaprenyl-diphosphate synthase